MFVRHLDLFGLLSLLSLFLELTITTVESAIVAITCNLTNTFTTLILRLVTLSLECVSLTWRSDCSEFLKQGYG